MLDNFRLEESPEFTYIKNNINKSIEYENIDKINKKLEELLEYKIMMNSRGNYDFDRYIDQLYLFTEGSIFMFKNRLDLSLSKFYRSVKSN